MAGLYDPFHQAVLRLIGMVAGSGHAHGVPVSICGEMGGDPLATVLLLGLGVESLSMSPGLIPEVKEVIRSFALARAREIADPCLTLKTGTCVQAFLEETVGPYLPYRHFSRRTGEDVVPDSD